MMEYDFCPGRPIRSSRLAGHVNELSQREPILAILLIIAVLGFACFTAPTPAYAGGADVVEVDVTPEKGGKYDFSVTINHGDEGWDHYANVWQVVGADGTVYGERVLLHPHVDEQPFTRSQSGIAIPQDVNTVIVRAGDSVHGFSGVQMTVNMPGR
jgi:hypothetical protein